ncbi:APC membrane recruitment protein 2 [Syngnathus typhle]|uniref:APC membrane recruitment protein 2 n=1 Tax=Syngnathus typhle TaxID=161592 RepID=UPI002A6B0A37|nr:APC membrane recruitment protein 2 [Syngnathus typhle]
MDVQTENVDPPPCESQPSGKTRKGFKLFGKRKPGNIFSLKNKSPVSRSQTLDGLPEGAALDAELEADKEKAREVSQGDSEHTEEEPTGEDGVLPAARNSISSIGSTKSISFFSRLRGTRRGGGERRVHTVCQPTTRQRQGLKGLFGSMKLRLKDKEDKVDAPPSPLLMSSRSNSVEIIKEDIGLTPKSCPRSPESHEKVTRESSPIPASDASGTEKDAAPLPATEAPVVPSESSLGSLLEDISSLLTFESISGGNIMADTCQHFSSDLHFCDHLFLTCSCRRSFYYLCDNPNLVFCSYASRNQFDQTLDSDERIPITQPKSPAPPATTPVPLPSPTAAFDKTSANEPSTNGQLSRPSSTDEQKLEEQHNGSRADVSKERRTQVKTISKIPVVGGARAGKLPVRDSQHTDDESSRDPPTPNQEDKRFLDNTGSRDKHGSVEVHVATFKHSQEESQQIQQSKTPAGVPRDSKIPVKHGAQSPTASQIPQAKETPRTKIPVSRVPVRRVNQ